MPMDDFVRLNGRPYSNKSCLFTIAAVPYVGILSMDYADKIEVALQHGANRDGTPLGMTAGKYSADPITMGMLADVFRKKFMPQLALLNAAIGSVGALSMAQFPISVQFAELPMPPDIDLISGCRFLGAKDSYSESADAMITELTIQPLTISRNGLTLYDRTRSIP